MATVFLWLVNVQFLQRLYDALQNRKVNPGYLLELRVSAFLVQAKLVSSTTQGTCFLCS